MKAGSFIPLLKLVVRKMKEWTVKKTAEGYSMNEKRLDFYNVRIRGDFEDRTVWWTPTRCGCFTRGSSLSSPSSSKSTPPSPSRSASLHVQ